MEHFNGLLLNVELRDSSVIETLVSIQQRSRGGTGKGRWPSRQPENRKKITVLNSRKSTRQHRQQVNKPSESFQDQKMAQTNRKFMG
jgi:hypothetical protein